MLEPLAVDPFEGEIFAGRYLVENFVGEGAMGRVYRARHTRMSKRFAIKIMFGDLAADSTMRARFATEAEAASRLEHPNVVSVVDFGETVGGLVYMVMEFVEGARLSTLIDEGPMNEARVRSLVRQISLGLQHAHDKGLVHRDLKADNVVVVNQEGVETPKIIDFGIAMLADAASGPGRLTAVGVVIGTPAYMSPEQACGEKIDHRSDLFSLGLLTYEMLAGKKPFDGHPFEVARQNVAATPPAIGDRTPGVKVDPTFEELIFQMLAKPREERPATAQAIVEAIDAMATPDGALERAFVGPPASRDVSGTRGVPQPTGELDLSTERPQIAGVSRRAVGWIAGAGLAAAAIVAVILVSNTEAVPTPQPEAPAIAQENAAPPIAPDTPAHAEAAAPAVEEPIDPAIDPDEPVFEDTAENGDKKRTKRVVRRAKGVKLTVENDEPPPAPEEPFREIAPGEVTARYAKVGQSLGQLDVKKNKKAAALQEQYLALPYGESMKNSALRPKLMRDLDRIEAEARRLRR